MMSRRQFRLLLLSVAFICALLMLLLHIAALQNGWYFSYKLVGSLVSLLGMLAVTIPLVPYIQSQRAIYTVLILFAILWSVFKISFEYADPIPPEVTRLFSFTGVALLNRLLARLLVSPVEILLTFLRKGLVDLWKEVKEMFGQRRTGR